jgi:hypothetical protein
MSPDQIPPLATFTVKSEMKHLLRNVERDAPSLLPRLKVYRMNDGHGGMVAEMSIDEILAG